MNDPYQILNIPPTATDATLPASIILTITTRTRLQITHRKK